jgi:hypothetical protein
MGTETLTSDFHFLEDVLNSVQGGKRLLKEIGARGGGSDAAAASLLMPPEQEHPSPPKKARTTDSQLAPKWRRLVRQAQERDTTLLLMPSGMDRHVKNTSYLHIKTNVIYWKLEFELHDLMTPGQRMLTLPKVSEDAKLTDEYIKATQDAVTEMSELRFLIKRLPCPSNKPVYVELEKELTLQQALRGRTVIEFPTILVVFSRDMHKFPLMIQEIENQTEST